VVVTTAWSPAFQARRPADSARTSARSRRIDRLSSRRPIDTSLNAVSYLRMLSVAMLAMTSNTTSQSPRPVLTFD
jgi:hypothetical protein